MKPKNAWQAIENWYWRQSNKSCRSFIWKDLCFSVFIAIFYILVRIYLRIDISNLYNLLFSSFSTALAFILAGLPILLNILDKPVLIEIKKKYGTMVVWVYRYSCKTVFLSLILLGIGILDLDNIFYNHIYNIAKWVYQFLLVLLINLSIMAIIRCFYLLFKCADRVMKE